MSSYWNYRIMAKKIKDEVQFSFYEVHYENDKPVACTENPVYPMGFYDNIDVEDPLESIIWQLDAMKMAISKPILDYDNFPKEFYGYSRIKKLEAISKLFENEF